MCNMCIHTVFDTKFTSSKYENFDYLAFLRRAKRNFTSFIREFMAWWSYISKKKWEEFFCLDVLKRYSVQALFKKNLKNYPKMLTVYFFNQINFWKLQNFIGS